MRMCLPLILLLAACAAEAPDASVIGEALSAKTVGTHPKATINIKAAAKVIARYDIAIRRCYERSLKNKPELRGDLHLELLIAEADGSVKKASFGPQSLEEPAMRACVERQTKRMRFPPPQGGDIQLRKRYKFVPSKAAPAKK